MLFHPLVFTSPLLLLLFFFFSRLYSSLRSVFGDAKIEKVRPDMGGGGGGGSGYTGECAPGNIVGVPGSTHMHMNTYTRTHSYT